MKNKEAEWFGYRKVGAKDKEKLVEGVFSSVAGNYDLMNDLMSGGIHRLWKNKFVRMMHPRAEKSLLDVAGGTGDIAFRYRKAAGPKARITLCDINKEMLKVGRDRATDRGYLTGFDWVHGNAEKLPFGDMSFDLYSISFGLRNVPHIDDALSEAYRVLKPGGRFFCLEFSQVKNPAFRKIYDAFSFKVIPLIGEKVAKDRDSYQYLAESIRQFPTAKELEARMQKAGFEQTTVTLLSNGIAAIHSGIRL